LCSSSDRPPRVDFDPFRTIAAWALRRQGKIGCPMRSHIVAFLSWVSRFLRERSCSCRVSLTFGRRGHQDHWSTRASGCDVAASEVDNYRGQISFPASAQCRTSSSQGKCTRGAQSIFGGLAELQGARRRVPARLVVRPEWRAESDHRRQAPDERSAGRGVYRLGLDGRLQVTRRSRRTDTAAFVRATRCAALSKGLWCKRWRSSQAEAWKSPRIM
jgi:hypothetical protein